MEDGEIMIYIKRAPFIACKSVLLSIPKIDLEEFGDLSSIDKIIEHYEELKLRQDLTVPALDPYEEFIAHCSNLQAWAEHDYDTRLLHSNLSFQLLKRLVKEGDPKAKQRYADEVAFRFTEGDPKIQLLLLREGYFEPLTREQKETLYETFYEDLVTERYPVEEMIKYMGYYDMELSLPKSYFTKFMVIVNKSFHKCMKTGYMEERIPNFLDDFFDKDLALFENKIFSDFCQNLLSFMNRTDGQYTVKDALGRIIQNGIDKDNYKELIKFSLQNTKNLNEFYAIRILMDAAYYLTKHRKWTIAEDQWLNEIVHTIIAKFELIETVFDSLTLFADFLQKIFPTPLFSRFAETISNTLHSLVSKLDVNTHPAKCVLSDLKEALLPIEDSEFKDLFTFMPSADIDYRMRFSKYMLENTSLGFEERFKAWEEKKNLNSSK
ncbi:MAG: hypothetical protein GF311_25850 [Candidatus Lokiarchaeota archaeon]|nr:hypothetical protein [Candidatus Lokiarchaeota archaeon]